MIVSRWCPHCGAENLPHRDYCGGCGWSLEFRCPACGFANRVGDRFCGGCGEALLTTAGQPVAAWRPAAAGDAAGEGVGFALPAALLDNSGALDPAALVAAENRLATIMKADLSGFTAMSELLNDPEEVTVIMNQVFDPLVAVVRRYGGYIDNYAGDMIISFFGAPETLEDGSERAVRAALEIRDEVARLNERNISHGVELGISTGVATGYGLWSEVGFGGSSKKTISGELGDYAALLEKYADRGTVGICPDTYARVQHVIPGVEQPGRVHRPGETEELPFYHAGPPRARAPWLESAAEQAGMIPHVGGGAVWRLLTDAWTQAEAGVGQVFHLVGEPGVGKTRLLFELAQTVLAAGQRVFAAGGRPLSEALGDDLSRDLRHAMLQATGVHADDTEARAAWLNSLGLSPRSGDVVAWLRAAAQQRPCLVILDALEFLPALAGQVVTGLLDTPALVVVASRTSQPTAEWDLPPGAVTSLTVPGLTVEETSVLAEQLLGREVNSETLDFLWRWSEGNPLYLREFVDLVAASDADFRWLPWRVQEHCDRALDDLGERDRAMALAAAAAADPETLAFEPAVVSYLLNSADWSAALRRLERAGLLRRDQDLARLRFRHRALWHTCRVRAVDSVKQQLAARVAEAAERLAGAVEPGSAP